MFSLSTCLAVYVCVLQTECMCLCVYMHVFPNVTSKTYPLNRTPAFIGINKANVSVSLSVSPDSIEQVIILRNVRSENLKFRTDCHEPIVLFDGIAPSNRSSQLAG